MQVRNNKYIIYLRGVKPQNYIDVEDVFDAQLIEESLTNNTIADTNQETAKYKSIPTVFKGLDSWCNSTNLKCWYCDFTFETIPVFIPTYIIDNDKNILCGVLGNFCSFSCASGHINDYHKDTSTYHKNLLTLYKIYTGKTVYNIISSPKRFTMTKYGGILSTEAYVAKINELEMLIGVRTKPIKRQFVKSDAEDVDDDKSDTSKVRVWDLS